MKIASCRLYQPGDEIGILSLYKSVFGRDISLALWRWLYWNAPQGPAVVVVAENSSGIVGHYAVQPRPFWVMGVPRLAGLAVGTMIHPSVRSVSLLVDLANMAYEVCQERGIELLYAFPNDQAFQVRRMLLGWKPLSPLVEWEGAITSLRSWQIEGTPPADTLQAPDIMLQVTFPANCSDSNGIHGARTNGWLKWRFFEKPSAEYSMYWVTNESTCLGYAVIKRFVRNSVHLGHIVDWQLFDSYDETAGRILKSIYQQFINWGVHAMSCWSSQRSTLSLYLRAIGLKQTGRSSHFMVRSLSPELEAVIDHEDNWNIYMGDSDVY